YTPTIPDELVEHYLGKSGFQCPDVRLIRLVAVATQKFIADVATDALHTIFKVQKSNLERKFGLLTEDFELQILNSIAGASKVRYR
uniref:Transcription initiation factor TFIID subunit 10-like n=1 Tax=Nicotiana tabacum TaxID=4097 RepID=A0A1S4BT75_TOBAC